MTTLTEAIKDNASIEMTEEQFWTIIDSVKWEEKLTLEREEFFKASSASQKSIGESHTYKELCDLRMVFSLAWNLIDKTIGDKNPAGGGDDSHGDLIAHIIGLGSKAFYFYLNDYSALEARGEEHRESFSYFLPYSQDYKDNIVESNEREYDVVIEATIRKTVRVKASNEEEATQTAHESFSVLNDGNENYDEQTISCNVLCKLCKSELDKDGFCTYVSDDEVCPYTEVTQDTEVE